MNNKTTSRRWGRTLAIALGVLALAGLVWWVYQPRPLVVEVAEVASGRFEQVIEEDGRLRLKNRYVITAPTQAELQRPLLKVGDAVKAGDVVAVLQPVSPQMIDARTRDVLSQRVGTANAARQAASAQVQRLQTALAQADLEAQRAAKLAQDNFISASARDQALLAQQAARQAVNAGRAELAAADFMLAEARAALTRSEPSASGRAAGLWSLKSPVDGQVLKLHLDSAAPVNVGQPLVELGDLGALEAVIDVLSGEVGAIGSGATVLLSTGGKAPPLTGRVERIEPVAFTKVSALGIEEQRVNVIVNLDAGAATLNLGDGFRVDARITIHAQDNALLAPSAALVRDGSGWRVFVVDGGRARVRAVTVKDRNADQAWIQDGLQAGETVLLYPGSMIEDGQAVKTRK
ncbi:HlyD family efflux transporter periplasmic adaptor subunit [Hydrogenophaga sp.]|uniref:efflux RND transporter periplasmic adaptor subunit n=1 Tax=Hydrogenophaga sp. TaxID=1904254 RepID=UPI0026243AB5|nr:HlyD family efflux transporter periplasmic adaptor subunit [Hydrogenophaga sp.]MDM7950386.1 HlyD family efflux transporter periplasmic adaptor subunit [Hydrogenophaga sp.]